MSNPSYIWITDENGSPIIGSSQVNGRVGAIELKFLTHNLNIPSDGHTGRLTGTRIHAPIMFQKEADRTTPFLYKALTTSAKLKSAEIKNYLISESGMEVEYFNTFLENVKIISITPDLYPAASTRTHLETILIRYEKITWKYCEGNIIHSDHWNNPQLINCQNINRQ